jgi:Arc/MetJ-type ribon-helix-helix transcriptional regulator
MAHATKQIATPPSSRRRKSTAADPLKKVTLRLHERLTTAIRKLVDTGEAASADAFIEEAVVAHFRDRRRARVYAAYAAAAADPHFMADLNATNADFDGAVADGLGEMDR